MRIIYEDGSFGYVLAGYETPELIETEAPICYYFNHPEYGLVSTFELDSIRQEVIKYNARLALN